MLEKKSTRRSQKNKSIAGNRQAAPLRAGVSPTPYLVSTSSQPPKDEATDANVRPPVRRGGTPIDAFPSTQAADRVLSVRGGTAGCHRRAFSSQRAPSDISQSPLCIRRGWSQNKFARRMTRTFSQSSQPARNA